MPVSFLGLPDAQMSPSLTLSNSRYSIALCVAPSRELFPSIKEHNAARKLLKTACVLSDIPGDNLGPRWQRRDPYVSICEQNVTEEKKYVHWTCKECRAKAYTMETLPVDLKHYQVHWQPQAECEADLCERNPALAQMVAEYLANRAQQAYEEAIAQAHPPRRNNALAQEQEQLAPMQKQGDYFPLHPQRYNIRLGEEWRNLQLRQTQLILMQTSIPPGNMKCTAANWKCASMG